MWNIKGLSRRSTSCRRTAHFYWLSNGKMADFTFDFWRFWIFFLLLLKVFIFFFRNTRMHAQIEGIGHVLLSPVEFTYFLTGVEHPGRCKSDCEVLLPPCYLTIFSEIFSFDLRLLTSCSTVAATRLENFNFRSETEPTTIPSRVVFSGTSGCRLQISFFFSKDQVWC